MIATVPPRGHPAAASVTLDRAGSCTIGVGTADTHSLDELIDKFISRDDEQEMTKTTD